MLDASNTFELTPIDEDNFTSNGDTITNLVNGFISDTPAEDYTGTTTFTYTVSETVDETTYTSSPITVTLAVLAAPTADSQSIYVNKNTDSENYNASTIELSGDDQDASEVWTANRF